MGIPYLQEKSAVVLERLTYFVRPLFPARGVIEHFPRANTKHTTKYANRDGAINVARGLKTLPQEERSIIRNVQVCKCWGCFRCGAGVLASVRLEHKIKCAKALPAMCSKCTKHGTYIEISQHEAVCETHVCPQCKVRGSKEKIEAHIKTCSRTRCARCSRTISLDENHDCPFTKCPACRSRVHRDLNDEHLTYCLRWKSTNASMRLSTEPGRASSTLLSETTKFPLLRGLICTMTAWMTNPENTAIADFEFFSFPGVKEIPCQVAIVIESGN
ncbi:hypothetical protein F5Y09DRAFT_59364 [Xylaria sp. FL1042]|nr:hypothetical protein F5Y09DRAFT_59364 [Xylaria sp. FL1042]